MWNKDNSLLLSKILVKLFIVLLLIGAPFIPIFSKWYNGISLGSNITVLLISIMYISIIPAFILLLSLNSLLKNISNKDMFVKNNVKFLRIISWCCFGIAIIYFPLIFFRLGGMVIFSILSFMGIILRVLKNVFEEAVILKEEQDYII